MIVDLLMPELNGIDLIAREHAHYLESRWMLMSGRAEVGGIPLVKVAPELPIADTPAGTLERSLHGDCQILLVQALSRKAVLN